MKKIALYVLAITSLFMASCSEDIDTSARYVFKEEIISGYLSKHEQYSEYVKLFQQRIDQVVPLIEDTDESAE